MPHENAQDILHGEEAIVALLAPLAKGFPGAFGLKDDCALLTPEPGFDLVLKTDPIAEGVHFPAGEAPEDVGWKALAVNVSDLAAKGAAPLAYLLALSFPEAPAREWLSRFAAGLGAAQERFGCHLVGGDTDRRPGPVTISVTVVGKVPQGKMVRRGTAKAGDTLFVSGSIGDAALGLALVKSPDAAAAWGLSQAEIAQLVARYRRPEPRLGLTEALRQYASAAMDVSDGLVRDLDRMLRASRAAGRLDAASVPLSAAARRAVASAPGLLVQAVTGGDDYEVLAAVPRAKGAAFAAAAAAAGIPVRRVGEVLPGPPALAVVGPDGTPLRLPQATGWDHF
jgi:thiamine-monophosphate kinase